MVLTMDISTGSAHQQGTVCIPQKI